MSPLKISSPLAKQIVELHKQGKDLIDIGRLLGLKKMQIAAVLAHQKLSIANAVPMTSSGGVEVSDQGHQEPPSQSERAIAVEQVVEEEPGAGLLT